MSAHKEKRSASLENIIDDEWEILTDLNNTMKKPELSLAEKLKVANAIAFHASVFNKLLAQRGTDDEFDESTLGDFVRGVEPRMARRIRAGYRRWTRKLSVKK